MSMEERMVFVYGREWTEEDEKKKKNGCGKSWSFYLLEPLGGRRRRGQERGGHSGVAPNGKGRGD